MVKDGWHESHGYDLYVEDGYVMRATKTDCNGSPVAASLYQWSKSYHCWINVNGKRTMDAVRSGLARGTYRIS